MLLRKGDKGKHLKNDIYTNILGIKTMAEVHYFEESFTVLLLM